MTKKNLIWALALMLTAFAGHSAVAQRDGEADGKRSKPVEDKSVRLVAPARSDAEEDEAEEEEESADLPPFARGRISREEYLALRGAYTARLRGIEPGKEYDVRLRNAAIKKLEQQEQALRNRFANAPLSPMVSPWTSIGPAPLPNGQTNGVSTPVSGRVTAIDVHPTNPNIAYVGTAQGGLYRTLDGGVNWTPLLDTGLSLAIGAITIDPADATIVFVGTGESNRSLDSYAGVGVYRINNADSANPIIAGPFAARVAGTGTGISNGIAFTNTSISRIAVDPNNHNRIFVGNTSGSGGISGGGFTLGSATTGFVGLYFSENAQAATPTFSRVNNLPGAGVGSVTDIVFEPGSSSNLLVGVNDLNISDGSDITGIYSSANANTAAVAGNVSPTFSYRVSYGQADSRFAINKVGATVTAIAAIGLGSGTLAKSTDLFTTFTQINSANGFCGGQCFYDITIAMDPADANYVYLGGSAEGTSSFILARSTDGAATFSRISTGLHADSHAITIAPSNTNTAYFGCDGGVWQTSTLKAALPAGVVWNSRNNNSFLATQFMSIATHPTDGNFTIGGTQDNGTELRNSLGVWTRADFGDGGNSLIDQNATDTVSVTMYHTYFNSTSSPLLGYARVTNVASAMDNGWTFVGCNGTTANGINCNDTAVLFYAPLEAGPGNPNTTYYGSDRLYRSADRGNNHTVVSQAPIVSGVPISAITISPGNDNVRLVGLRSGALYGTFTGSSTLTDLDPSNAIPNVYVSRIAIGNNDPNRAYVALSGFNITGGPVWRTSTLSSRPQSDGGKNAPTAPTWVSASGSGATALPSVPVNALVTDPVNDNIVYAGTDIGVYVSIDAGATWEVFGTDLPRVAVFDMSFVASASPRTIRIATHGKGMYDHQALSPTAIASTLSGRVVGERGRPLGEAHVTLVALATGATRTFVTKADGQFAFPETLHGAAYVLEVSRAGYIFSNASRAIQWEGREEIVLAGERFRTR